MRRGKKYCTLRNDSNQCPETSCCCQEQKSFTKEQQIQIYPQIQACRYTQSPFLLCPQRATEYQQHNSKSDIFCTKMYRINVSLDSFLNFYVQMAASTTAYTAVKKKKKKKKKFKLQAFLTSKPVHSSSTVQNLLSIQISISQLILYFSKLIECQPQLSLQFQCAKQKGTCCPPRGNMVRGKRTGLGSD